MQNGLAISGDYLCAASFLGIAGLIFLYGFDGFLYSVGFLVAFLTVMFLLAERMRNAGKYTIADVLSFRLRERPARTAAALGTLTVVAFYLIAQMVGAGVLIQALVGIDFCLAVLITGVFMLCYVIFGGMLATTWVQIIKAVLLMVGIVVMSRLRARARRLEPDRAVQRGRGAERAARSRPSRSGRARSSARSTRCRSASRSCSAPRACRTSSCGSSRCPTRRPRAARSSTRCSSSACFYVLTTFIGFGARAILGAGGRRGGGHGRQPRRAEPRAVARRRRGHVGGDLFLAIIAAVAFATILAVVAGLVLSASGAVAHDIWSNIVRKGQDSEHEEVWAGRIAAVSIGAIAIAIAIIGGEGLNVSFMVGLAFAVAASANFPALLLALTWRRFNTTGAVTGVLFGVVSAIVLVIISPTVWPGPDGEGGAFGVVRPGQPGDHLDPARVPRLLAGHDAEHGGRATSGRSTSCMSAPRPGSAPSAPSECTEAGGEPHGRRVERDARGAAAGRAVRPARRASASTRWSATSREHERAAADPQAWWAEQAEALHWFRRVGHGPRRRRPAVLQVVRGREDQRVVQLPGPPRRGGHRRPRRVPLARRGGRGRATSPTPTCSATSSASPTC